jgi:cellulose synthase/poly-beta-1,6-N-acetylglucosamine synthase-like glycosyltransferase
MVSSDLHRATSAARLHGEVRTTQVMFDPISSSSSHTHFLELAQRDTECAEANSMTGRYSARDGWSNTQKVSLALAALAPLAILLVYRGSGFHAITIVAGCFSGCVMLMKIAAILSSFISRPTVQVEPEQLAGLQDDELPLYTLLWPLHDEAAVVPQIIAAVAQLDYPKDKLDTIFIVEEEDGPTRGAFEKQAEAVKALGARIVVLPQGDLRTKPRACNYALAYARGEFLVVYDAEDWPDSDQLKKSVAAFSRFDAKVACLQAQLNFHNYSHNVLTRLFTLEYTAWYDIFLTGLCTLGAPVPLGGTSNHFRRRILLEVGAWDSFNVTEDCDLGIRLARSGYKTLILDSTTWEQACGEFVPWLKQRSRWIKGYVQTTLVHTRDMRQLILDLGWWPTLLMLLTVAGSVVSLAITFPSVAMVATSIYMAVKDPLWRPEPYSWGLSICLMTFLGYFVLVHMYGAYQRRRYSLIPYALLLPAYWACQSVATLRGLYHFFTQPFNWEKTPHQAIAASHAEPSQVTPRGDALSPVSLAAPMPASVVARARRVHAPLKRGRRVRSAVTAGGTALIVAVVPPWLLRPAPQHERDSGTRLNENWTSYRRVRVEGYLNGSAAAIDRARLTMVYVTGFDGEWYQHAPPVIERSGARLSFVVDLDSGWVAGKNARPWSSTSKRRIRELGVRLTGPTARPVPAFILTRVTPLDRVEASAVAFAIERALPAQFPAHTVAELRFSTGREWQNPFDAQQVSINAIFEGPDGVRATVPAFYSQDYVRGAKLELEELRPQGQFFWAARFSAATPGRYRWHLEGSDSSGAFAHSPSGEFEVTPSQRPGYVRVDQKGRRFVFDSGKPFFPVGINVTSPNDGGSAYYDFTPPQNTEGSRRMEAYLTTMKDSGITLGRVWLSPWFGGLEWQSEDWGFHGAGQYNLQNAWRVDRVLEKADELGIFVELLLYPHGPFQPYVSDRWGKLLDSLWAENPYNAEKGGPVTEPGGFIANEAARRGSANYLRYVGARYGAYASLFGWTLWNEADTVTSDVAVLADWHRKLAPVLRANDLGRHVLSTEFREVGYSEIWDIPQIDYVQTEAYAHWQDPGLIARFDVRIDKLRSTGKPIVLEEYGGGYWGGSSNLLAQNLHDGLWVAWMKGLPSTPFAWWWTFLFEKKLTQYHRVFADFIGDEPAKGDDWRETHPQVRGSERLRALASQSKDAAQLWVYDELVTEAVENPPWGGMGPTPPGFSDNPAPSALDPKYTSGRPDLFPEQSGAELELEGLLDGDYAVELWDTWRRGEPVTTHAQSRAGLLRLSLPSLTRDVALKIKPRR